MKDGDNKDYDEKWSLRSVISSMSDTVVMDIGTERSLVTSGHSWSTVVGTVHAVLPFWFGLVRIGLLRPVLTIAEPWDEGDGLPIYAC